MIWIWLVFAALVAAGWLRYRSGLHRASGGGTPRIDDEALRRILRDGTLPGEEEPLDMDDAARAEDEFWEESWDEPEEYGR